MSESVQHDLIRFIELCRKDDGGYALIPDWLGSAYGTRLAFQSLVRLELPIVGTWQMKGFISNLLAKRADGTAGYIGYPKSNALS